jgi:hypothetical protein
MGTYISDLHGDAATQLSLYVNGVLMDARRLGLRVNDIRKVGPEARRGAQGTAYRSRYSGRKWIRHDVGGVLTDGVNNVGVAGR